MIVGLPANDFVVLDVETTGLEPAKGEEVIEVAAQKLRGREVVDQFVELIRPTKPVPAEVQAVHGISPEMLAKDGQPAATVFPRLVEWLGTSIIIAHNSAFDMGFINTELERLGLPRLNNKTIDTVEVAKRYLILSSYRLASVAAYLKVPQPSAHRALVDVETTREVFFKLIDRAKQKS